VFRQLVLARIIEPASKIDSLRVLEEAGEAPPSYATLKRRLPAYAQKEWQQRLSAACATHARLGRRRPLRPRRHGAPWAPRRAVGASQGKEEPLPVSASGRAWAMGGNGGVTARSG